MKHLKSVTIMLVVIAAALMAVMPAAAQETPPNTITVTGNGSASGTPDMATIVVGIEIFNADLTAAFTEANTTIDNIINAVEETGVSREDIRTSNLNIFLDRFAPPPMMEIDPASSGMAQPPQQGTFVVSNQVRIIVRDVDNVAGVIDAAVGAGANNIFGLNFGIDDTSALQSEARAAAVEDARARAQELADLTGVTLGSVVSVRETSGNFGPGMDFAEMSMAGMGGGGAVVEPGTVAISTNVTITFAIEG